MSQSTSITGSKTTTVGKEVHVSTPAKVKGPEEFSGIKWLDALVGEYNFNRYGIYAIALLLIGVLAGTAVGLGAMTSPVEIAILIIPTMASLVMILAVAPMRILLWTVIIACIIDICVIIYHLVSWSEPMATLF
ncbi:MAG: hypothetical protein HUJ25_12760 [Crocinitomicaceae bacterium]|nr:hypothetical protein [Crocinitomicaceae bacterium]